MKFSRYKLLPLKDLNRHSNKSMSREGVLIEYQGSYFDYHPWEEFGDITIDAFLKSLKQNGAGPVMQKFHSLWTRRDKIELKPFLNHSLNLIAQNIKLKYSTKEVLLSFIENDICKSIRIDFNNLSSLDSIKKLWLALTPTQQKKIQYLEDPFPKNESWLELIEMGIPLACDRNIKDNQNYHFEIYKPNVDILSINLKPQVFSSYMGHDLGRYLCYLELMDRGDLTLVHGIDTPNLFEKQRSLFIRQNEHLILNVKSVDELMIELRELNWEQL